MENGTQSLNWNIIKASLCPVFKMLWNHKSQNNFIGKVVVAVMETKNYKKNSKPKDKKCTKVTFLSGMKSVGFLLFLFLFSYSFFSICSIIVTGLMHSHVSIQHFISTIPQSLYYFFAFSKYVSYCITEKKIENIFIKTTLLQQTHSASASLGFAFFWSVILK